MRLSLVIAALSCASPALAQVTPQDTARSPTLNTVVVTAERARTSLPSSVASVTRLSAADLARTPRATLADVLRRAPGFAVIDFDGLGFDPQLMVRGFYGGGEAEYVVVLIDGRPVNQLQTGLVAWDVLPPLASIEAVEIVRGSASPLYGDAAIGGVINVITKTGGKTPSPRWDASGGSFESYRLSADVSRLIPRGPVAGGGGIDRTGGFRDHAERTSGRARVTIPLAGGPDHGLAITGRMHWRKFDEPGPLLESLMEDDRAASDPLFRFDHTRDQSYTYTLDGHRALGARTRLTGSLGVETRTIDAVRTLALAPGFGDTKLRESRAMRGAGNIQIEIADSPLPGTDWMLVGAEISDGSVNSRYYRVAGGTRADYATASGERGPLDAEGDSRRTVGSVHAQYNLQPSDALRLAVGGRFDALRDAFRPDEPSIQRETVTHTAFSPRVGLNLRYLNRERSSGNAYITASRSFKAATLDQLYDLRSIPIPDPPFAVRTSNPELDPQHGTSIEAGLYHTAVISPSLHSSASLSVYQMAMKDELDFDVATFRYVNIGRSRHRGVEAGLMVSGEKASTFANYALQSVTSRRGANDGKRLKAIPRQTLSAGLSLRPIRMLETSLLVTNARDVYLDDANSVELPDFTRLDARVAVPIMGVSLFVDVRNLLDKHYSSTGFLDPAGSGEPYFYPAAGRVLEVGLRGGW
jgi:iron complex outermembrane receptor protein